MNKLITNRYMLAAALMAATGAGAAAQSAVDAYNLSQTELRGTARFMSMAGAFTALGGDISTLNQNPGGIGVYRGSDIGFTFDVNMMNAKTSGNLSGGRDNSFTKCDVNDFGYIGTVNLGNSGLQTISWGVSYARLNSFNRQYSGVGMPLSTSMSNYITTFTDGYDPGALFDDGSDNNPYQDYSANAPNWLSVLAFNGGLVTPQVGVDAEGQPYETDVYDGLFQYQEVGDGAGGVIPATTGTGAMTVNESGYTDEYSINFGGNVSNVVYWGLGVGITDLGYTQNSTYTESLANADVPVNGDMGIQPGNGGFQLSNWKHVSGTGVNVKLGLILKPINELRIGVAFHTPTYWSMTTSYNGRIDSRFSSGFQSPDYNETPTATYDWRLHSPWKLMVGVAGVIGGRGIISADYEYQAYNAMNTRDADGTEFDYFTGDIKNYFKASNTLRIGGEFRVTPQFSIRAGYAYTASNLKEDVKNSNLEVYTNGTNPAYTFDSDTQYITCGLGYRFSGFYADLAYVYKHRESTYRAFTSFKDYDGYWYDGPSAKVTDNNSQLVFTIGYRF
ncbi:MAG: outer membrane protein transport protein [[Clostridium] fimetarium]|nr:outer membrane protein transport protein [Alistipes timonensis]MCM1406196.1 outer membrane protein transport protein [[Clostridium] fimetarium]